LWLLVVLVLMMVVLVGMLVLVLLVIAILMVVENAILPCAPSKLTPNEFIGRNPSLPCCCF